MNKSRHPFSAPLPGDEVPSPIDFTLMKDAVAWAKEANVRRKFRYDYFRAIGTIIKEINTPDIKVLELGAGPGFLAEYLLASIPISSYDLFDFSLAMHELSSRRLAPWKKKCCWLTGDFRQSEWSTHLEHCHVVVTMQALHELRHKRYATAFHNSVLKLLLANGVYLMCDHYAGEDGMSNEALFMTPDEHMESLKTAGFNRVRVILKKSGLILFDARM